MPEQPFTHLCVNNAFGWGKGSSVEAARKEARKGCAYGQRPTHEFVWEITDPENAFVDQMGTVYGCDRDTMMEFTRESQRSHWKQVVGP